MNLWIIIKTILGYGTIPHICLFHQKYKLDFHDYPIDKGGDGIPSHFYTYKCSYCGKEFTI